MPKGEFQPTWANKAAGRVVKAFRDKLGQTQTQFAWYLHDRLRMEVLSQEAISELENGHTTVAGAVVVLATESLTPIEIQEAVGAAVQKAGNSSSGPYLLSEAA